MRPDAETNNNFLYCLGEAAQRYSIVLLMSQMESNHHHTDFYDPIGYANEFTEHFHKMLSKCQNAYRRRSDKFWSEQEPSRLELVEANDVIERMAYSAINPVKDNLVERVRDWPGPAIYDAFVNKITLRVRRPKHFFVEGGRMPDEIDVTFTVPPELGDRDEVIRLVQERVEMLEAKHDAERRASRRRVLGRQRVLDQDWNEGITLPRRREASPRIGANNDEARMFMIRFNSEFRELYKQSRNSLLSGSPVAFPAGTYFLRRFANVPVATGPLPQPEYRVIPILPRSVGSSRAAESPPAKPPLKPPKTPKPPV